MNIYLAGPMRGIPEFNYPAFAAATKMLRANGHTVFSPAEKDIERLGTDVCKGTSGDLAEIEAKGFNLREALLDDLTYILTKAEAIALLPGWKASKGVAAEVATAIAIGIQLIELDENDWNKQV